MTIEALLVEEHALCRTPATSRKRVLQEISHALATTTLPEDELFDGLMARERLGSTGLGDGVAIPHCRADVDAIKVCLATLPEPVDYEASDGRGVDIFVALIVPHDEHEAHLSALAELSTVLSDPTNRHKLRDCTTATALCESLRGMLPK